MRFPFVLLVAACLLVACSDDEPPASTATPRSTANASPVPTAVIPTATPSPSFPHGVDYKGPVLLYSSSGNLDRLIAYDLGAHEELWAIDTSYFRIRSIVVAGNVLAIADNQSVRLTEAGGTEIDQILVLSDADQERVDYMAASSDGRYLAITVGRVLGPTPTPLPIGVAGSGRLPDDYILIYDLQERREVRRFDFQQLEFEDFTAFFGPTQWREDGRGFFMWGATNSERAGNDATMYLDGTVVRHDSDGFDYLAPDGHHIASGFGTLGCMFISSHDVVLRDLDDGTVQASLHDGSRAFTGYDWSPDGSQFLFESRAFEETLDCEEWINSNPTLLLMDAVTGSVSEVTDLEALYRSWYGDELAWLDCQGEFVPSRPHPFGNTRSMRCDIAGTFYFAGEKIDNSAMVSVLGVIE